MSRPTMADLYARVEAVTQPALAAEARKVVRDAYELGYAEGESSAEADAAAKLDP